MEKYGFVYIWRDCKHKRFYIGCHWGTEDDGYVCSSRWMNKSYKRRPEDFKRRILSRVYTNRFDMLEEEHKWLKKIKPQELKKKYYNVCTHHFGHWSNDPELAKEVSAKLSKAGRSISDETRQKMSDAKKGKNLSPATQFKPGQTPWNAGTTGKQEAWNKNLPKEQQPKFGKKVSEETKRKISAAQKGRKQNPKSGMNGRKHSEETKRKIAETKRLKRLQEMEMGLI